MVARELREALRERTLVAYSLLIPLLLYPMMMWLGVTGVSFVRGQADSQTSRIEIVDLPPEHRALWDQLEADDKIELSRGEPAAGAWERVQAEEIDLSASFEPVPSDDAAKLDGNFVVDITFDASEDRSTEARDRFEEAVSTYRKDWLKREAAEVGIDDDAWEVFAIERANESTGREMGAFMLGLLAPTTMIIMVAMGAMYPAIDSTAGERERSTWETSLTLGVERRQVVLAKYLYVSTMATVAGLLNLTGIAVALATTVPQLVGGKADVDVHIPWTGIPIVVGGVVLLALLLAAGMMIVAAFAKTFREGQSMASPVFLLVMLPVMVVGLPEEAITLGFAAVPVVNIMLVMKQAITMNLQPDFVAVTVASTVTAIGGCLWLATRILRDEELVLGSFQGSAQDFLRTWLRRITRGGRGG